MNKVALKTVLRQSTFQLLVLVVVTIAGLVGISYIMRPESVSAFFHIR
ncbi:hypothetical protein MTYP_02839 [Methylophilaceae bacterium]|nr:hypothetical protein MTYP_02839 [Methylophilaceae bacterium]